MLFHQNKPQNFQAIWDFERVWATTAYKTEAGCDNKTSYHKKAGFFSRPLTQSCFIRKPF